MSSISVVIPAYNAGRTITHAVRSALSQSLRPCEVIVVDDASRDETCARLDQEQDAAVIVLKNAYNLGGAASRNRGIAAARGQYIALLDADDVWTQDKLARQMQALAGAPPGAAAFCAVLQTNEYGERHTLPQRAPRAGESMADFVLKSGHVVQTSTLLVPTLVAQRCPFAEDLRRFQDIDFVLRVAAAGTPFVFVAEPLAEWRSPDGPRVSRLADPSVLRDFWALHPGLTLAQRLGLRARSLGPRAGLLGIAEWAALLAAAAGLGALPLPNAASLLLKQGLGVQTYAALRRQLGRTGGSHASQVGS